jgi:hypothetical protein
MIALITTCDPQRFNLLRPFVAHYRAYGVRSFFINLHFDVSYPPDQHAAHSERANALLGDLGLSLHSVYSGPFDAMAIRRHHDSIQKNIASRFRWLISADLDEFHEFPDQLDKFAPFLESKNLDGVRGRFVDRMARAGFPELQPDVSIWRQFPLGTDMTRAVLRGWIDKVMLHRPEVRLVPGHHDAYGGANIRFWAETCAVHHFKWDATVVPRLRRRLEEDWRRRCPWWTQSERALSWLGRSEETNAFPGLRVFDFHDDIMHEGEGPLGQNPRYLSSQNSRQHPDQ